MSSRKRPQLPWRTLCQGTTQPSSRLTPRHAEGSPVAPRRGDRLQPGTAAVLLTRSRHLEPRPCPGRGCPVLRCGLGQKDSCAWRTPEPSAPGSIRGRGPALHEAGTSVSDTRSAPAGRAECRAGTESPGVVGRRNVLSTQGTSSVRRRGRRHTAAFAATGERTRKIQTAFTFQRTVIGTKENRDHYWAVQKAPFPD